VYTGCLVPKNKKSLESNKCAF